MFYANYVSIVSIANNASNYLHYVHDFMQAMQVIPHIICSICDTGMIQIFEYFGSNNNPLGVMQSGFGVSISSMLEMQVLKLR